MGLSGSGNFDRWAFDIDEIDETYGMTIGNGQWYLQVRPIAMADIEKLISFLNGPMPNDASDFVTKCFGGHLGIVLHDGCLSLRIMQDSSNYGTNLIKLDVDVSEIPTLVAAANEAIRDAKNGAD